MVTLRRATADDSEFFLRLRNDPVTVAFSRTPQPVSSEAHTVWFAWALHDLGTLLFVVEDVSGTAVGTCRLASNPAGGTELSLTVAPDARGQGHGTAIVAALLGEAWQRGLRNLYAEVRPENLASLRIFLEHGFVSPPIRLTRSLV